MGMDNDLSFSDYLKKIRKEKGFSVNQLALYSGVSSSQISRIENGIRGIPKPDTIQKLSKGLKVPYDELMAAAGYLDNEFGRYMREHREIENISIKKLSEMTEISVSHLLKIERGEVQPTRETVEFISSYLDIDEDIASIKAGYSPKELVSDDQLRKEYSRGIGDTGILDEEENIVSEENKSDLTPEEHVFFKDFKGLSDEDKQAILKQIRALKKMADEENEG
jgi:transcriptional regulator with XRE-family HTH domain